MGKPVRKEKKLLHPEMDAGCFLSLSSGKEFWFSKAAVVGSCGTHSHPPSLVITDKPRRVVKHYSGAFLLEEESFTRMLHHSDMEKVSKIQNASSIKIHRHHNLFHHIPIHRFQFALQNCVCCEPIGFPNLEFQGCLVTLLLLQN